MINASGMKIAHSPQELQTYLPNLWFRQNLVWEPSDISPKRLSIYMFSHQKHLFGRIEALKKLDDIWMFEFLQYSHLSHHTLLPLSINELIFLVDLDSNLALRWKVSCKFHSSIGTFSQLLSYWISSNPWLVKGVCAIVIHFRDYLSPLFWDFLSWHQPVSKAFLLLFFYNPLILFWLDRSVILNSRGLSFFSRILTIIQVYDSFLLFVFIGWLWNLYCLWSKGIYILTSGLSQINYSPWSCCLPFWSFIWNWILIVRVYMTSAPLSMGCIDSSDWGP